MLIALHHYPKEADTSFDQFEEKVVQNIELKKLVAHKVQDINEAVLDHHVAFPTEQARMLNNILVE